MKPPINIPLLIITLATVSGIGLGKYLHIDLQTLLICFFISVLLLGVIWHKSKKIQFPSFFFSVTTIWIFLIFGMTLVQFHNPKNNTSHYTNIDTYSLPSVSPVAIKFRVQERLKPSAYHQKYIIEAKKIENRSVTGNILLQIPKKNIINTLTIGNTYIAVSELEPISPPKNPDQFDYAQYMANQYVYHKITIPYHQLVSHGSFSWSFYTLANRIRNHIKNTLSNYSFSTMQLEVIYALILGQRQDINPDTINAYKNAGAIHILAISGLHIGILFLILQICLKPITRIPHGKTIKLVLIIVLMLVFAWITGLTPSICRATAMFSFMAIAKAYRHKANTYNALLASIFLILCFRPLDLFSVGFQLSYAAVIAIVWIQPIWKNWYRPKFFIDKTLWETLTTTMAAQIGILPLSLFYFHQFPLLFLCANLLILPFIGCILSFGLGIVILAIFDVLPELFVSIFGDCIDAMNFIVYWISDQNDFLLHNITFSGSTLLLFYLCLISSFLLLKKPKTRQLIGFSSTIVLVFINLMIEQYRNQLKEELIVYHHHNKTAIGILASQELSIFCNDSISQKAKDYLWGTYCSHKNANLGGVQELKNSYRYKKNRILIIDSTGIYPKKGFRPDLLLLSHAPNIHLKRIIKDLQPKKIIADGSNYRNALDHWEKICNQNGIAFHRTDKMGAFVLAE